MEMPDGIKKSYISDDINYFTQRILKNPSEENIKKVIRLSMEHAIVDCQEIIKKEPECPGPMPLGLRFKTMFRPATLIRDFVIITKNSIHFKLQKLRTFVNPVGNIIDT